MFFSIACLMDQACSLVAVDMRESALRCVLYPDTHACAPAGGAHGCRLIVKEPAPHFYLRLGVETFFTVYFLYCSVGTKNQPWTQITRLIFLIRFREAGIISIPANERRCFPSGMQPFLESPFIPGHGRLLGGSQVTHLSSESKRVLHFLGVPYARPPIAGLRFRAPQPTDWTGSWNATYPR